MKGGQAIWGALGRVVSGTFSKPEPQKHDFLSFGHYFSSSFSNFPGFGSPTARCDVECVSAER